eukprot:SM000003S10969  [mRNA]  locus=s3:53126:54269:- [translate_table: standard]
MALATAAERLALVLVEDSQAESVVSLRGTGGQPQGPRGMRRRRRLRRGHQLPHHWRRGHRPRRHRVPHPLLPQGHLSCLRRSRLCEEVGRAAQRQCCNQREPDRLQQLQGAWQNWPNRQGLSVRVRANTHPIHSPTCCAWHYLSPNSLLDCLSWIPISVGCSLSWSKHYALIWFVLVSAHLHSLSWLPNGHTATIVRNLPCCIVTPLYVCLPSLCISSHGQAMYDVTMTNLHNIRLVNMVVNLWISSCARRAPASSYSNNLGCLTKQYW